jgi:hypothetical protein
MLKTQFIAGLALASALISTLPLTARADDQVIPSQLNLTVAGSGPHRGPIIAVSDELPTYSTNCTQHGYVRVQERSSTGKGSAKLTLDVTAERPGECFFVVWMHGRKNSVKVPVTVKAE